MSKAYLVHDLNDPSKFKVEYRSHKPKIGWTGIPIDILTGELEDAEWLQVENLDGVEIVTVDEVKKGITQSARQAAKEVKAAQKELDDDRLTDLKQKAKNFGSGHITGIVEIRAEIDNLYFIINQLLGG